MYWWTDLYYGRLLSAASVARLKAASASGGEENDDDVMIAAFLHAFADDAGRCILRPPGCLVRIGRMDPVLDDGDSAKGYVSWRDLRHASRNAAPGLLDAVENGPATERDAATLQRLLRLAAPEAASDADRAPGVYICEASWSTHAPETCHVTKNIRVRDD